MESPQRHTDHKAIVQAYFAYFDQRDFEEARSLLSDDLMVWYPNTREVFQGSRPYIQMNQEYPGHWRIELKELHTLDDQIITITRVYQEGNNQSFHAVSFFRFNRGKISEIHEYWGEDGEAPQWRLEKGFSKQI